MKATLTTKQINQLQSLCNRASALMAQYDEENGGQDYRGQLDKSITAYEALSVCVGSLEAILQDFGQDEPQEPGINLAAYKELKAKYPDALLLFRCGDFYETYCQDAEDAAKVLGIVLTYRGKTAAAGFPFHALDTYLPKLVRSGRRVAICDDINK